MAPSATIYGPCSPSSGDTRGRTSSPSCRQVIRHGTAPNYDVRDRLEAAGLVRCEEEDKVVPGNGLYARFFKDLT